MQGPRHAASDTTIGGFVFALFLIITSAVMVLLLILFRLRRQRRLHAKPVIISDASVLIAFARIRRLGLAFLER